jgi:hypothetical protein
VQAKLIERPKLLQYLSPPRKFDTALPPINDIENHKFTFPIG